MCECKEGNRRIALYIIISLVAVGFGLYKLNRFTEEVSSVQVIARGNLISAKVLPVSWGSDTIVITLDTGVVRFYAGRESSVFPSGVVEVQKVTDRIGNVEYQVVKVR